MPGEVSEDKGEAYQVERGHGHGDESTYSSVHFTLCSSAGPARLVFLLLLRWGRLLRGPLGLGGCPLALLLSLLELTAKVSDRRNRFC